MHLSFSWDGQLDSVQNWKLETGPMSALDSYIEYVKMKSCHIHRSIRIFLSHSNFQLLDTRGKMWKLCEVAQFLFNQLTIWTCEMIARCFLFKMNFAKRKQKLPLESPLHHRKMHWMCLITWSISMVKTTKTHLYWSK